MVGYKLHTNVLMNRVLLIKLIWNAGTLQQLSRVSCSILKLKRSRHEYRLWSRVGWSVLFFLSVHVLKIDEVCALCLAWFWFGFLEKKHYSGLQWLEWFFPSFFSYYQSSSMFQKMLIRYDLIYLDVNDWSKKWYCVNEVRSYIPSFLINFFLCSI